MISLKTTSQILRSAMRSCDRTLKGRSSCSSGHHYCSWKVTRFIPINSSVALSSVTTQIRNKSDISHKESDLYNVSKTFNGSNACDNLGLDKLGIHGPKTLFHNLTYQQLFEHEVINKEGKVATTEYGECFAVDTGKFTGRSPKDKWVVLNKGSDSETHVDWGEINQATTPEVFDKLYDKAIAHFNCKDKAYVFDCYCGANPKTQKKIRFVHEMAWQQHFVTNMFIRPETREEIENFEPDFTVINACSQIVEDWKEYGLNSEVAVVFNIEKKCAVIFGTWYGGENKKGIFSLMNYWLPKSDPPVLPMHCSANLGYDGDVALFFGLSGTGKTTLSADPHRALIGDDEHGWDEDGIFNFEGGCYAKTINLSKKTEPDIYRAIRKDAMLENVKLAENEKGELVPDYFDVSKTENGRVSYPIFHIDGYHKPQMAGHPTNIIFLTCDAFGVLPPVSKLTPGQAMYHFISGYTAKVAGTERGVTEPTPNFSACFGAAFMSLHPNEYAAILEKKIADHGTHAWLVNTGWSGGSYGVGKRMSIQTTRSCIDAILDGSAAMCEYVKDDVLGFDIPVSLPGVETHLLNPRNAWKDKEKYDKTAKQLAEMFAKNFKKFDKPGSHEHDLAQYGPRF